MSGLILIFGTNAVPVNQVGGCGTQNTFLVIPFIMFWNLAVGLWPSALFLQLVPE